MRFKIRTFIVITVLFGPVLFALRDACALGYVQSMIALWGVLVAAPVTVVAFVIPCVPSEGIRDRVIAIGGALAVVGYVLAAMASVVFAGLSRSRFLQ